MRMIPKNLALFVCGVALVGACAPAPAREEVITTAYPTEFLAGQLSGGMVPVRNLTATGAEPHDLELSPRQVDAVQDARLVIVVGEGFQPAVDDAVRRRKGMTVDLASVVPEVRSAADPHVWLDPVLMRDFARATGDAFIAMQPDRADAYRTRLAALDAQLVALDAEFRDGLADCRRRTFFTTHDAFGWLARRYRLTQVSITGRDPEAEPSAARIAEVADRARREGATTVFAEPGLATKPTETLAREAGGLRIASLSPIETRTPNQVAAGDDYVSIMRANLEELRTALGCM